VKDLFHFGVFRVVWVWDSHNEEHLRMQPAFFKALTPAFEVRQVIFKYFFGGQARFPTVFEPAPVHILEMTAPSNSREELEAAIDQRVS